MRNKLTLSALLTLAFLVATSGVMQASAITGSLPFVMYNATQNGPNLLVSTQESTSGSVGSATSGPGTGDFAVVPFGTDFGNLIVFNPGVGTGGGFIISNPVYGAFAATGGSIVTRTANFLDVDLTGFFIPGPGIPGVSPGPVMAHVSFNQTGPSLAGSFTLASVPEPGSFLLLGSGFLGTLSVVRRKLLR
jgi:hypothetical protein